MLVELYMLAAVLNIFSNVAFGTATVFYYAYLPLLTDAHPRVRSMKAKIEAEQRELETTTQHGAGNGTDSTTPSSSPARTTDPARDTLLSNTQDVAKKMEEARHEAAQRLHAVRDEVGNELSTHAFGASYSGGALTLVIMAGVIFGFATPSNSTYLMQACVASIGVWWLIFALGFAMPWLKERPGPPLPKNERSYFLFSWKKTFNTFRHAAKLKHTFIFLMSWFVYADGYSTIATVAILFGKRCVSRMLVGINVSHRLLVR